MAYCTVACAPHAIAVRVDEVLGGAVVNAGAIIVYQNLACGTFSTPVRIGRARSTSGITLVTVVSVDEVAVPAHAASPVAKREEGVGAGGTKRGRARTSGTVDVAVVAFIVYKVYVAVGVALGAHRPVVHENRSWFACSTFAGKVLACAAGLVTR